MSLQGAAAGFGRWCEQNKVIFSIPLMGLIGIGANCSDVLENFNRNCQRKVQIRYDKGGRETAFYDENGDIVSFSKVGIYVESIKSHGIATQIPQSMIYNYKAKSYLSNICIDGHMIWIKNMNEIKLKAVSGIPCVSLSLEDLGVKIERITKSSVDKNTSATRSFNKVSNTKREVKAPKTGSNTVDKLTSELEATKAEMHDLWYRISNMGDKLNDKSRKADKYAKELSEAESKYKSALACLNGSFSPGWSKYTLEGLVGMGKLHKDEFGALALNKGSKVPTFYTKEDAVRLEETDHPQRGDKIVHKVEFDSIAFNTIYTVAHDYKETITHDDTAYKTAKDWCMSREYEHYHDKVESAYAKYVKAKKLYDESIMERDKENRTPDYIAMCVEYKAMKDKYKSLSEKQKKIESMLYK